MRPPGLTTLPFPSTRMFCRQEEKKKYQVLSFELKEIYSLKMRQVYMVILTVLELASSSKLTLFIIRVYLTSHIPQV